MVSIMFGLCISLISLVQINAYGETAENQVGSGQRYSGVKILPPPAAQYPGGQHESRPSVGGYGTIPPPAPPQPIQYPPVPPPIQYPPVPAPQERSPQYNKNQASETAESQQYPPRQTNSRNPESESGLGGNERVSPHESSRGGERGSPAESGRGRERGSSSESGKERSPPFESGQETRHPKAQTGEESEKANLGSEPERYTQASPNSRIGIKPPMQPGSMPETSPHGRQQNPPKEGPRTDGIQYDEKTENAKPSAFFGDSDARNLDRPLGAPTKKQEPNEKTILDTDEKQTECSVQPNGSPPKCNWKPNQEHHLNLWPHNMFASICESLVKTVTVCQSMCELQSECQSIHFCPNCVDHNCRLISEKQNGKNGLKLVQEFKFVDYYEKTTC